MLANNDASKNNVNGNFKQNVNKNNVKNKKK